MPSYVTRVGVFAWQCRTPLAPGARQSAVAATDATIKDRLSLPAALPVVADRFASQLLSAPLPGSYPPAP